MGRNIQKFFLTFVFIYPFLWQFSFAQQHEPDLKWFSIRTEHFVVHYPEPYEKLAKRVAQICEQVYDPVSQSLHYFPRLTHVVLHTRSDISNGFVNPLPWRMELFIAEPQANWIGSKDNWLRLLITHEFTHVVHLRKTKGISKLTYPFFGQFNAFWQLYTPNWFIEGFATHNETRFTRGGRGRNPYHLMQFLSPLKAGKPWRLANTNFLSRKRQPRAMNYIAGYFLTEYVTRQYGAKAWAKILDAYSKWPFLGFGHAVKKVTHKSAKKIYQDVLDSLNAIPTTIPFFKPAEPTVLTQPQYPGNQYSPRWDGSGHLIAYRTSFDKLPALVSISRSGREKVILQRRFAQQENSFSAGSRFAVWSVSRPHPRFSATKYFDLELFDRVTKKITSLTRHARVASPDLSPNEKRIVAVQTYLPTNRLVLIHRDTGKLEPLLEIPGYTFLNPRWSKTGRWIAFAMKDSTGQQDIAIIDLQTRKWRFLYPPDIHHDNNPCWTPDDRYVLFTSDRTGIFNIWAVEVATGQRWLVTNDSLGAFAPDVSADGKMLAYGKYTFTGFSATIGPLDSSRWLREQEVPENPNQYTIRNTRPLKSPQDHARSREWSITGYQPWRQILWPQGWFPVSLKDEHGNAFGLFGFSQDALHRHAWQGFFALSPRNFYPSWDLFYRYSRWWPELSLRHRYTAEKIRFREFVGWWRQSRLELSIAVPLTLEQNVYTTFLRPFATYLHEDHRRSAGRIIPLFKHYRGLRTGFQFFRGTQTLRDIVPHKGFAATVFGEWSIPALGNEFTARQFVGILNSFWPTFINHHQIQILVAYQSRRGNFSYSDYIGRPIGYNAAGRRQQFRSKIAYHFPLAYLEWPLPIFRAYLDDLSGILFYDWGTSWNHGSGKNRWLENDRFSAGFQLNLQGKIFQILPARLGIAYFYQSATQNWKWQPSVQFIF